MPNLNYAVQYASELAQAYPYVLYFAKLRSIENDRRYKIVDGNTVKIQSIKTSGRVDGDRDTISLAQRNYNNSWETKTLSHYRKWSTLVHPQDLEETKIKTIGKITDAYNTEQKFPEMDAYLISKLYADWTTSIVAEGYVGRTPVTASFSASNVMDVFDQLKLKLNNARVPVQGRICYVTFEVLQMIENSDGWERHMDITDNSGIISRGVYSIDGIEIVPVPAELMQSLYDFTVGYAPVAMAKNIKMFMTHPSAMITPEIYESVKLDAPTAMSENKYVYYEESYDDAFILNNRADGLQFAVTDPVFTAVANPTGSPIEQGYCEKTATGVYVYSEDKTVDATKTYYTRA